MSFFSSEGTPTPKKTKRRAVRDPPPCPYGKQCFKTCASHRINYSHDQERKRVIVGVSSGWITPFLKKPQKRAKKKKSSLNMSYGRSDDDFLYDDEEGEDDDDDEEDDEMDSFICGDSDEISFHSSMDQEHDLVVCPSCDELLSPEELELHQMLQHSSQQQQGSKRSNDRASRYLRRLNAAVQNPVSDTNAPKRLRRKKKTGPRTAEELVALVESVAEQQKHLEPVKQPDAVVGGTLKRYQLEGVAWLRNRFLGGHNGILGDEMGLGKTVQMITLIQLLNDEEKLSPSNPVLCVVPASTIHNWQNEFSKWAPSLKLMLYYGDQKERQLLRGEAFGIDVYVATFTVMLNQRDLLFMKGLKLGLLVVDEAQEIKNESARHKNLRSLKTKNNFLLTGTPMQNRMEELFQLLKFIGRDLFAKAKELLEDSDNEIHYAKRIMQCVMLRRLKKDVYSDLPQKKVFDVEVEMNEYQMAAYKSVLLSGKGDDDTTAANICMSLRKCANHPLLCRFLAYDDRARSRITKKLAGARVPPYDEVTHVEAVGELNEHSDWIVHSLCTEYLKPDSPYILSHDALYNNSAKMTHLVNVLLPELFQAHSKILIFSQMTKMLDILQSFLKHKGYRSVLRIDGQTPVLERQPLIDQFSTDDDSKLMLLSTRAGGVGINLTAASAAVFYDISWNPHVDLQAQDRIHRLGQKSPIVSIYRLIVKGTIDEDMLRLQNRKASLSHEVLGEHSAAKQDDGPERVDLKKLLSKYLRKVEAD